MNPNQEFVTSKQSGLSSNFSLWLDSQSGPPAGEPDMRLGDNTLVELMDVVSCLEIVERVWPGQCDSELLSEPNQTAEPIEVAKMIGPYRLIKKIAEGGMGAVFEAQQLQPIERTVALKLIKTGRQSKQVIARFEAERQVLAMMNHSNIAKIFDAGTTTRDEPYFVMELVDGIPLVEYCDANRLSIADRLRLFIEICRAVQHAHQKGVVHRDLKPSNVLVGLQGDASENQSSATTGSSVHCPKPKIIDFGLAKAVQHRERLTDKYAQTRFGEIVGTLQYMSPEQAAANHDDIDTQTDVYSLGVMLYELLTGSTPLNPQTVGEVPYHEVLEIICTKEPARPSQRLRCINRQPNGDTTATDSAIDVQEVACQRKTQPSKLRQMLQGELDWIVMKALELEPQRRYQAASEMAEDIQRYLDGEAVVAGPQSRRYQLKKLVMRNRGLAAALATIFFLLAAGLAGSFWGLRQAWESEAIAVESGQKERLAKEQAVTERTKAQKAATKYKDVLAVFERSFQFANPMNSTSADISADDVINTAYQSMDSEDLDADAKTQLLAVISNCFIGIGQIEEALAASKTAYEIQRSSKTAISLADQVPIVEAYAEALIEAGDANLAHDVTVNFLNEFEAAGSGQGRQVDTLEVKRLLAESLQKKGDFAAALKLAQEVRDGRLQSYGRTDLRSLVAGNTLAIILSKVDRAANSSELLQEVLADMEANNGQSVGTFVLLTNLGVNFQKRGKYRQALPLLQRAVSGLAGILGPEHPRTLAAKGILGQILRGLSRDHEALEIHRRRL